jgi:hypothetical protein
MRAFYLCAAFLATTAACGPASAQTRLREGTPVIIVGRVSSPPRGSLNEQKMQVAVGPQRADYTLHFGDAVVKGMRGRKIDEDRLDDGMWVRAEGHVMDDPRRIRVDRMRVISRDKRRSLVGTRYYRRGYAHGYVAWPRSRVAGTRQYYRSAR